LPEGNTGIARKYPGDARIADDPAVLFADDFESYTKPADLGKRWDIPEQRPTRVGCVRLSTPVGADKATTPLSAHL